MSLATRCPACGTTFRVVQDQLKVSGGWVRCGQCHQVFNGLEALHELSEAPQARPAPTDPAPAWPPAASMPGPDADPDLADEPDDFVVVDDDPEADAPSTSSAPAEPPAAAPEEEPIPTGEVAAEWSRWPDSQRSRFSDSPTASPGVDLTRDQPDPDLDPFLAGEREADSTERFDPIVSIPPFAASRLPDPSSVLPSSAATQPAPAEPDDDESPRPRRRKPAFMREAERAAQWRRPAMRAVLGTAASLLGLMLALQVGHQYRDELAARWPATRGALQAWCDLARCTLQPPRALARLTLESTGLQRTERPQELRFEADLHNSAEHNVRAPALEINFHDLQGRTLARKVLLPEALEAPPEGIAADGVWHVSARLNVGELRISGFAAEVFYP